MEFRQENIRSARNTKNKVIFCAIFVSIVIIFFSLHLIYTKDNLGISLFSHFFTLLMGLIGGKGLSFFSSQDTDSLI